MQCNIGFCGLVCLALLVSGMSMANERQVFSAASQECAATIGATLAGVDATTFDGSYMRRGLARIGRNIRITYVLKQAKADSSMPRRVICKFDKRKKVATLKTS